MNEIEKLAIAQALYKGLAGIVSTKDPDSLRSAVDAEYRTLYEETGAKSYDVRVNGHKVGTYSFKDDKDIVKRSDDCTISDSGAFAQWLKDNAESIADWDGAAALAEEWLKDSGEVPDGVSRDVKEWTTVQKGGGTLRIDSQKVLDALGAELPSAMNEVLLLGEGA